MAEVSAVRLVTTGTVSGERTNMLLRSQEFDNVGGWGVAGATVSADAVVAPDGTLTADKLQEDNSNGTHITQQFVTFVAGVTYTFSVYAKAAERGWVVLILPSSAFGSSMVAYFNLSSGAVGTTANGPITYSASAGNGWWRFAITKTATASAGGNCPIEVASADNVNSYVGTTGSGIYLWGAQLEQGLQPSVYITTTSAAAVGPGKRSRLVAWSCVGSTAATVELRDGNSSGTVLANIDMPGGAGNSNQSFISDERGVVFPAGIYMVVTGGPITGMTVIYSG